MSSLQIEVWDATGNKRQAVEVPAEAEVARVIAVLVERMNLPRHSPDGQLMSYKFHHRGSGRQLLEEETLLRRECGRATCCDFSPRSRLGRGARWLG